MPENTNEVALESTSDILTGLNTYIEGKMKRYSLLFAVNGGAFAIAKLLTEEGYDGVGGLSMKALAVGAILFTILMWRDIHAFGSMMRTKFFADRLVFEREGKRILAALSLLLIAGWLLAAFWPVPSH